MSSSSPNILDNARGARIPFLASMFFRLEAFEEAMWIFCCFMDVVPGSGPT